MQINQAYWDLHKQPQRYIITYGGRRSGKSWGISQLLALKSIEYKRHVVVMRKVARTLRLSTWPRMQSALADVGIINKCKINKSDMAIEMPNGSVFWFVGADDPEKLKSLEGATDYWLEESPEFDEQDFQTVDAGLSAACNPSPQIYFTFNPIPQIPGSLHWIQRTFLPTEVPIGKPTVHGDALILRTTYKQNKFCPAETKKVLEGYKKTQPDLYRMWALGEFVTVEGAILSNWDVVPRVPDGVPFHGYGLDFGFSADPATLVKIWKHNDDIYAEECIYESGLTNQALAGRMRETGVSRYDVITADSAEPKSIEELRQAGFACSGAHKSPDYKRAAAQWLQSKHIHIVQGSTNMIREISTWSWMRDKHGNQLPKPADGDDHTVDALIYGVYDNKGKTLEIRRW
ncbi:MAG: PBSX family phage terminase large subunit, partial [Clostridia bacterium]|nr:PBSX family phage terminase large subunit [Clostridia bacterium]